MGNYFSLWFLPEEQIEDFTTQNPQREDSYCGLQNFHSADLPAKSSDQDRRSWWWGAYGTAGNSLALTAVKSHALLRNVFGGANAKCPYSAQLCLCLWSPALQTAEWRGKCKSSQAWFSSRLQGWWFPVMLTVPSPQEGNVILHTPWIYQNPTTHHFCFYLLPPSKTTKQSQPSLGHHP